MRGSISAAARIKCIDEVEAERISLLGTAPLLLELSSVRITDAAKHLAMVDLFRRTSRGSNLLLDPTTRRERELRAGGALSYPAFVEPGFEPSLDAQDVDTAAAARAGYAAGIRFAEAEKASDAASALKAQDLASVTTPLGGRLGSSFTVWIRTR